MDGLLLYLADALSRYAQEFARFLESAGALAVEAETQLDDGDLALRQVLEHFGQSVLDGHGKNFLERSDDAVVLDEI
jgi:hypothetical protein